MNKLRLLLVFISFTAIVYGQTYKDGWGIGFGLSSPRMFGDVYAEYMNFGGHLSIQKDFDEVNTLRLKVDYLKFTSNGAPLGLKTGPSNTTVALALDYLYGFSICHPLKLYFGTGFSIIDYTLKDAKAPIADNSNFGELSVNFIVGTKYTLSKDFELRGEFSMHQISTDRFDGVYAPGGGLFGGTLDSYLATEVGAIYYFDRGPETKICEAPGGITNVYNQANAPAAGSAAIDYDRIQRMIDGAKISQAPVDYKRIEDIIDAKLAKLNKPGVLSEEPVLVGINFNVNDASIKPENYAVLAQDVRVLLLHPDLKVEVAGYTDKDGSDKSNQTLSEKRAENVKNYLVAKGVDASRLTVKGYGETTQISDNKALNRRVELKIVK